jgi:hypothetical protein
MLIFALTVSVSSEPVNAPFCFVKFPMIAMT